MFHVPAHKAVHFPAAQIVSSRDSRSEYTANVALSYAAPYDVEAAQRSQNASYAVFMHAMRSRWAHCKDLRRMHAALQDCNETLALQDGPSAYVGKLLAEMDVIRDVLHALRSKRRAA